MTMNCAHCGQANPPGREFCRQCGAGLDSPEAPAIVTRQATVEDMRPAAGDSGAAVPQRATVAREVRCASCGAELSPGTRFCSRCGAPAASPAVVLREQPTLAQSAAPAPHLRDQFMAYLRFAAREPTGVAAAATVVLVCTLVSWLGWVPLSLPARLISAFVDHGDCAALQAGSLLMYPCSAKVALLTVAGPLAVIALLLLLRGVLGAGLRRLIARLPEDARFLAAPALATVMFVMSWADVHKDTAGESGLLPQTLFPAVVGLFAFVTARYGAALQRILAPFFAFRDRFPLWQRMLVAVTAPLLIALLLTLQPRVTEQAAKEQFVVLITLGAGYLALAPRSGDILSGIRQMATSRRHKV
jgi:Double zinc ribbon